MKDSRALKQRKKKLDYWVTSTSVPWTYFSASSSTADFQYARSKPSDWTCTDSGPPFHVSRASGRYRKNGLVGMLRILWRLIAAIWSQLRLR